MNMPIQLWSVGRTCARIWVLAAAASAAFALAFAGELSAQQDRPEVSGRLSNVVLHPADPEWVSVERRGDRTVELVLFHVSSGKQVVVGAAAVAEERDDPEARAQALFQDDLDVEGSAEDLATYYGDLDWRPVVDPRGLRWFTFVAPGDDGRFDPYLGWVDPRAESEANRWRAFPLPVPGMAASPRWSPDGRSLLLTIDSELHVIPDVTRAMRAGRATGYRSFPLLSAPEGIFYPAWSPDGRAIAFDERAVSPAGEVSWGFRVVNLDPARTRIQGPPVSVTAFEPGRDQRRASWSPDGRFIAYHADPELAGTDGAGRRWEVRIVEVFRSDGDGRIGRGAAVQNTPQGTSLATQIIAPSIRLEQNQRRGPQWIQLPQGERFIGYVEFDPDRGDPLTIARIDAWLSGQHQSEFRQSIRTESVNHRSFNLAVVPGTARLVFLAHAYDEDQGGTTSLRVQHQNLVPSHSTSLGVPHEASRWRAMRRSAVFPGLGQRHKGQSLRGIGFSLAAAAGLGFLGRELLTDGSPDLEVAQLALQEYREAVLNGQSPQAYDAAFNEAMNRFNEGTDPSADRTGLWLAFVGAVWLGSVVDAGLGFPVVVDRPWSSTRAEEAQLAISPIVAPAGATRGFGEPRVELGLRVNWGAGAGGGR